MNRHFDFLFKDQAEEFFQKVAMAEVGIPASRPVPVAMTKTASAKTDFEKVASRLDRDIGILKLAGKCGLDGGMEKRASAYIDVLLSNVTLSPDEFAQVFDKVAAHAIDADMNAAYADICENLPVEFHYKAELVLMKCGSELVKLSQLEKEAFAGALVARMLGGRGVAAFGQGASKALGTVKHVVGKPGRALAIKVDTSLNKARAGIRKSLVKTRGAARLNLSGLKAQAAGAKGATSTQRASARAAIPKARAEVALRGERVDMVQAVEKRRRAIARWGGKKNVPKPGDSTAGTTMAGKQAPKLDDIAVAKQKQTKATAEKAEAELKVLQGRKGKGTGTDGPAPKPGAAKTTDLPASAPDAVKADPKLGESWKKMTSGQPLTPEERGGLISAGIKGAIGYRLVTGGGVVTGGEGII